MAKTPPKQTLAIVKAKLQEAVTEMEKKNVFYANKDWESRWWCVHCGAYYIVPGHNLACPFEEMQKLLRLCG